MFSAAIAAGLTSADITRLLPVSRATASSWLNGHSNPHSLIKDRVINVLGAVEAAVTAGDLPMVETRLHRSERTRLLKAILEKHATKT